MTRINIELEEDIHKRAKIQALLRNQTLIEFLHEALKEKVEEDEKKKAKK